MLNYSGKAQKEIGILLNILQPHVSKYIGLLIEKMRRLATLFTTDRDAFFGFIELLRSKLPPGQFQVVSLLLSGYSYSAAARHLNCTPANICKLKKQINHHLTKAEAHLLKHYKDIILG
jgi:DNA-binding CsgD family transcriptional regulator